MAAVEGQGRGEERLNRIINAIQSRGDRLLIVRLLCEYGELANRIETKERQANPHKVSNGGVVDIIQDRGYSLLSINESKFGVEVMSLDTTLLCERNTAESLKDILIHYDSCPTVRNSKATLPRASLT